MKKQLLFTLIFMLLAFGVTINSIAQYGKWQHDTSFKGIEFKKIKFRTDEKPYFSKALYANGVLEEPTVIQGFPCHGKIILDKDGILKQFRLAEDAEVAGNKFKKNTFIAIRRDKSYHIACPYRPNVQGYEIRRTPYRSPFYIGSTNFQLYPNGRLSYFLPVDDIEIDGVRCRPSATRGGVHLYENGKLKECTSAGEQTIQGKKVYKNYELKFDENGNLTYMEKEKIF